jgi:hypothetical protein
VAVREASPAQVRPDLADFNPSQNGWIGLSSSAALRRYRQVHCKGIVVKTPSKTPRREEFLSSSSLCTTVEIDVRAMTLFATQSPVGVFDAVLTSAAL